LPVSIVEKSVERAYLIAFSKFGLMVLYQCNWANVDVIMIDSLFAGKVSPFAGKK